MGSTTTRRAAHTSRIDTGDERLRLRRPDPDRLGFAAEAPAIDMERSRVSEFVRVDRPVRFIALRPQGTVA